MRFVLITGLSGSGKSVALDVLEDAGYYCVDNLPVTLLPDLAKFLAGAGYDRIALSMDVRSGNTLPELPRYLAELRGIAAVEVLFLDSRDETLIKRFSETRRRHPLSDGKLTLPECIARERQLLEGLSGVGHRMDTSDLSPNALRSWIKDFIAADGRSLTLLFESFGFKHGIPLDADFVFDVRCIPNPHYDPVLRPLTGRDSAVIEFLNADADARRMLDDIRRFVREWLPCFKRDNRSYLTIAIGCTGGRHRSVFFAEALAREFEVSERVLVRHRHMSNGESS